MLLFENRYQAINYYKKQLLEVDEDLQDWLSHNEKIKQEKITRSLQLMREINDSIDWNRQELKREQLKQNEATQDEF